MADKFKLVSNFKPTGDQPQAILELTKGVKDKLQHQTLLGVTGSGKTFTAANIIANVNKPTLVIAHNKTLAAQLCAEFREFFPENAVDYFVSYYDYYQPEAYLAHTDTYIEKDSSINEEIDTYRHAATRDLLTRRDVLIVASVSCIYGIGSPEEYRKVATTVRKGDVLKRQDFLRCLTDMQYQRNDIAFGRGKFRVRGDVVEIHPSYEDQAYRFEFWGDEVEKIEQTDPVTGETSCEITEIILFPAKHAVTSRENLLRAMEEIKVDLEERVKQLQQIGKNVEAQRIRQRTEYDLEMMLETGYCNGIENYQRYLAGSKPGDPPFTLMDFFPDDFLLFIDESHMTVPQIGAMYEGNKSRKNSLVEYGFRLPSAQDNRPLKFAEFEERVKQAIYVSATPSEYELKKSKGVVVEQLIRPTGLLDPEVEVRPTEHQIDDLLNEIRVRVEKNERVLITTLTKKMSEKLADYLAEAGIKVRYLHSEIDTFERIEILRDLRLGTIDVIVGINLLREGLDLPEVSLVAILDADKEGFLRSEVALIQTIGRTARHAQGRVIMYADKITRSMKAAIDETNRRRGVQASYNKEHGITPQTIIKKISDIGGAKKDKSKRLDIKKVPKDEVLHLILQLEQQMDEAAAQMDFEKAADLRDQIEELELKIGKKLF
ncbi:MAG: excinuclease ABC subunit UvrB [Candidatus Gracilibacteria bacterium]|nr:excinuclease ABC subunit UvrB [Candidatus Gracilibacteria bacterium]